ncbi:hypothetical protein E2C01_075535 [Portunus trituberculatus]|uniref:Uncharacterized protein n=1 Tax=Portunus trituberculatus TaxID=210409 RepID=A0A5B7IHA8_PORTR|nr:hypothetical protein [Portunus trituberculatus]
MRLGTEGVKSSVLLPGGGGVVDKVVGVGSDRRPRMSFGDDMGPNMGTTINKIACATNGRKVEQRFPYTLQVCLQAL